MRDDVKVWSPVTEAAVIQDRKLCRKMGRGAKARGRTGRVLRLSNAGPSQIVMRWHVAEGQSKVTAWREVRMEAIPSAKGVKAQFCGGGGHVSLQSLRKRSVHGAVVCALATGSTSRGGLASGVSPEPTHYISQGPQSAQEKERCPVKFTCIFI